MSDSENAFGTTNEDYGGISHKRLILSPISEFVGAFLNKSAIMPLNLSDFYTERAIFSYSIPKAHSMTPLFNFGSDGRNLIFRSKPVIYGIHNIENKLSDKFSEGFNPTHQVIRSHIIMDIFYSVTITGDIVYQGENMKFTRSIVVLEDGGSFKISNDHIFMSLASTQR